MAAAATTAGCGNDVDKAQACENLKQEIQTLARTVTEQSEDPDAVSLSILNSASKIRAEGEPVGGDVQEATESAATALERLATQVAAGEPVDLEPVIVSGQQIREACDQP